MRIEIEYKGFRVTDNNLLILITPEEAKWKYDFYYIVKENEKDIAKPVCAPFLSSGYPWYQQKFKDSYVVKCLKNEMDEESAIIFAERLTNELYKISDAYLEGLQQKSGYDYSNTIQGIPKCNIKTRIHPSIDYFEGTLYLGYRYMDELKQKKEWIISSKNRKVYTPESLQESEGILLHDRSMIGDSRWKDLSPLETQSKNAYNLFQMIKTKAKQYIWFSNPLSYDIISLWIMGTYMYWGFNNYPYIHLSGTPDSGKSTVQRFISCLAFNGYFTESISNPSIFRYVEEMRATLCIDEQEFLASEDALQTISILNSGYHKAGKATRQEPYTDADGNKKMITVSFSTYSPKVLSGLRGLDKTLQTRSIGIPMKPANTKEYSRREIEESDPSWQTIRDELYVWALDSVSDVMNLYKNSQDDYDTNIKNRMWQKYHAMLSLSMYFKNIVSSSDIHDNLIRFIRADQEKTLDFQDYLIDLTFKGIYRCVTKYPNPKNQYPLKLIREEIATMMGFKPPHDFSKESPLAFLNNIHHTIGQIGYKTIALTGNYRGLTITKEQLEMDVLARGINLQLPIIVL